MAKSKRDFQNGYVYSTDPDFKMDAPEEDTQTPAANIQKLRIWLETKNRGGKAATVIKGFSGHEADLKELGKKLKNFLGTGGAVKDREIIIQGDQREKVLGWLIKEGFSGTKIAGK
ncbi:translation initiation factor [Arachidicoccus terrestris]|uniref:translation initiation factor n=1 Tax=Arachidicoccus terrestris TaxID=2875539 RepID=UPI001CC3E4AE|nr:translation initiation factor [Arachidicoccus terrestris]UAY54966.1 translation initiation factor [Arachidicoccus terrestris]